MLHRHRSSIIIAMMRVSSNERSRSPRFSRCAASKDAPQGQQRSTSTSLYRTTHMAEFVETWSAHAHRTFHGAQSARRFVLTSTSWPQMPGAAAHGTTRADRR